jgi:hypothetical protein
MYYIFSCTHGESIVFADNANQQEYLTLSKWKPRREFKAVSDKRASTKKASKKADPTPQEFQRDLEDLEVPDLFTKGTKILRRDIGGSDKLKHDGHILMMEWAIKYADMLPRHFLMERRGYSESQAETIIAVTGSTSEWANARDRILDSMSESVIKRHIDKIVEVNDQHISASKLTMAKAIEMLTKLPVDNELDPKTGKPKKRTMRSIDLVNCANAIEKAQTIYRRAMGLPNEESGIAQILEKVANMNVQNNVQINNTVIQPEKSEHQKRIEALSYEDIMEFVEYRREQKKLAQPNGENTGS